MAVGYLPNSAFRGMSVVALVLCLARLMAERSDGAETADFAMAQHRRNDQNPGFLGCSSGGSPVTPHADQGELLATSGNAGLRCQNIRQTKKLEIFLFEESSKTFANFTFV